MAWRKAAGRQRPERPPGRGHGVVGAEAPEAPAAFEVRGQHGLLQGGEGPGFDDLGRQGAGQGDKDEQPQGVGGNEDDTTQGQGQVQDHVAAPPPDAVGPAA